MTERTPAEVVADMRKWAYMASRCANDTEAALWTEAADLIERLDAERHSLGSTSTT